MVEEIKNKDVTAKIGEAATQDSGVTAKIGEVAKKTAEVYETVSEEKALEETKDTEAVTEKMIKKDSEGKEITPALTREEAVKEAPGKFGGKPNRRRSYEKTTEEILEAWTPKTKLGKDAKNKKIKNINDILDDKNKKILESEIVDSLIPIKSDLISIGQAKGKFGGGKRRAWRQTQRITNKGGVMTFSAMAVAGDENGHVGIGVGKAKETLPARDKSVRKAKLNLIKVTRGCASFDCSCSELHSIPFVIEGKSGSVKVKLMPAPQGTGLVVANELKKILKLAGIKDVYSKIDGRTRTTFNLAKACIEALKQTNRGEVR
jgi:small subunit ribosomal protein S5